MTYKDNDLCEVRNNGTDNNVPHQQQIFNRTTAYYTNKYSKHQLHCLYDKKEIRWGEHHKKEDLALLITNKIETQDGHENRIEDTQNNHLTVDDKK